MPYAFTGASTVAAVMRHDTAHLLSPVDRREVFLRPSLPVRSIDQRNAEIGATLAVRGDSVFIKMSLIGASFAAMFTPERYVLRGAFHQADGALSLFIQRGPAT